MREAAAAAPALRARASVALRDAGDVVDALCDHFAEHGEVTRQGGEASVATPYGRAFLAAAQDRLTFGVESPDETSLAFMKMAVAEHLVEFAGSAAPPLAWTGDGSRSTVPPFFREMRVLSARQLTPRMRRVTLAGEDLGRFAHGGLHVRLLLPPSGRPCPKWPELGPDGRMRMPEGGDALTSRVYTIRRIDAAAGEIDIDMVLHPGAAMPGAEFAMTAKAGDLVGITGPGGGHVPDAARLFLFGDETALPAIGRILSELEPHVAARAFVEIADEDERQDLASPAECAVEWLVRKGRGPQAASLLSRAVRETIGPGDADAFVWAAGEFASFRDVRRYLRGDLKRDRRDHLVVAYWRRGVTGDGRRAKGSSDGAAATATASSPPDPEAASLADPPSADAGRFASPVN